MKALLILFWRLKAAFSAALLLFAVTVTMAQGYPPAEAISHMTVSNGLKVKLYASEPIIAQPVCIEFDDRGRLWVIQYLQYPNPAGLQRAKVDRWSRTTYDRVPEPPPRGPKGADRITILEDTGGRADRAHDFITGLNLASGIAFGHGGVFVLNVPYLLFYPDRNGDDAPDSDPEVLLSGFGMEDAHSVANSLTWGPDGWLYGCQGSTVTAHIRGIEFQQGVWRYHPLTHRFELFCEGGGNSWGLDFDEDGNLFFSTNLGGYRMLHGVQGGYYWKSFGKHGALHNPYTFGYFDHVPHRNFQGGHVTTGGIVYQGDSFPAFYRGKYISGDLLGHQVQWHSLKPLGSTFTSAHGGDLLVPHDLWSAPCDVTMGSDGAVYVADWFDKRTAHPDPDADWDRSNGRIYRIEAGDAKMPKLPDLTLLSTKELIGHLGDRNDWVVRKARRILADRRDAKAVAPLRKMVFDANNEHTELEALWALYVSGGFDESFARRSLNHPLPQIRWWTVRLLGDQNHLSKDMGRRLVNLGGTDLDVRVRSQLASTAARLPAAAGLEIAHSIAARNLDGGDPYVPLLLWWAVERYATNAVGKTIELFASPTSWNSPLIHDAILGRLMRRYAAEGTEKCYVACAKLLASAPSANERKEMLAAIELGLHDRPSAETGARQGGLFENEAVAAARPAEAARIEQAPPELTKEISSLWSDETMDPNLISVAARFGRGAALARAQVVARDSGMPAGTRAAMLRLLGELRRPETVVLAEDLLSSTQPEAVQLAALESLQAFDQDDIGALLLRQYPAASERVRSKVREVLLSRKSWALAFLQAVDQGRVSPKDVPVAELRLVALHQDKQLDDLVIKHWGNIKGGTGEEKLAEMRRFNNDLNAGRGNPVHGHELFRNLCAGCHRLYNEGEKVGPDLTVANRADREFLLASLVDPSAVIRKEFLNYNVVTKDGAVLSGLIAEQSPASVTLVAAKNERTIVNRDRIASVEESAVSLMPESLLNQLKSEDLRDLFSYLQSEKPVVAEK